MTAKKRTRLKIFLAVAIALAALLAGAWLFVSHELSELENVKETLTTTLSEALDRDVTYQTGKAGLTFRGGLALELSGVVVRNKDRSSDLLTIDTVRLRARVWPLLFNRIVLGYVELSHPRLTVTRDAKGVLNIADLLAMDAEKTLPVSLRRLSIDGGLMTFADQAAGRTTSLAHISCRISKSRFSDKFSFQAAAVVLEDKNKAELALNGAYHPSPAGKPLSDGTLEASVLLKGADLRHYAPYLKSAAAIEHLSGKLDAETALAGTPLRFTAKGSATLQNALWNEPRIFRGPVASSSVRLDYTLARDAGALTLNVTRLAADRLEASGRAALADMDGEDPHLSVLAATTVFSLKGIHSYVPWKIIPRDVGDFIESHIPDGNFRLVEGKLEGRLSQIKNLTGPDNAGVLYLRAEVNKGIFTVNRDTPEFSDIAGTLELDRRRFLLKNMKGRFGRSPLTLDGGISDFALPGPSVYSVRMSLEPTRDEIVWLFGKESLSDLRFAGPSTLHLSGTGPADKFAIGADWDLAGAAYAFPKIMEKPKGRPNRLVCDLLLGRERLSVTSFRYDLPPLAVTGSVANLFAAKKPVALKIQAAPFDLAILAELLPALQSYSPAGTCALDITGGGNLDETASFRLRGSLSLTDVSLKPPGDVKPIQGITGRIDFRGNRVETSLFQARIGETAFSAQCDSDHVRAPKVGCQFSAAELRTADLGLESPEGDISLQNVRGKIFFEENHLRADRLSFRLGKTRLRLSGDIRNFAQPKISSSIVSRYLDWNDVARLLTLSPPKKSEPFAPVEWVSDVRVDAGVFHGVDFSKLSTRLTYTRGILNMEALEAGIFEGSLQGKLRVDFPPAGQNSYQATVALAGISLDQIQSYLKLEGRTVTGKLSLAGQVKAAGSTLDDFTKTANGAFQLRADKGVLMKFSVLSKIFSLLNVSQLVKLKLPDMAKDGMPYNAITGDMTLKNGLLSSNDFFIASDAMQISIAGKVDLVGKTLDTVIGVHPLQTLDRIAARIPVAGWLVTDEKGNLITVHFKADGTWDNPSVRPIPVQSITKGTLDVFRKLFELPEKLVTDTGEVLLGR